MTRKPLDVRSPFTRAQALTTGLTDRDLRSGLYRQLFWGVYVSSDVPESLALRARAALMISPGGTVVSHHTAARLWGATAPADTSIHTTYAGTLRPQTRGVRGHRADRPIVAALRKGVAVTSAERTFLDMVCAVGLVEGVVVGDGLVKARVTTVEALVAAAERWRGPHRALVRRSASLVRARVDSPMETRLRLLVVLAGLPEPTVNLDINDSEGWCQYRIDLAFEGVKVAVEYDGRHHVERKGQWSKDVLRREDLEGRGWRFVVVTSGDYYGRPEDVVNRVISALTLAGLTVSRRRPAEWRRIFGSRISA